MLADSTLPVSFLTLAHALRPCFGAPTFTTFVHLLAGMICAPGRRTVTGMLTGAHRAQSWSHDRAHEFFSTRAWDPIAAGELLTATVIDQLLPPGAPVQVSVDDTLFRRRGTHVWAASWTHDGSARSKDKIGYGNTWVVLAITVALPFTSRPIAVPVMARVWQGKNHRSRSELALDMVTALARIAPGRTVHVVADAAYHHRGIAALPAGITWTTPINTNAALYAPPPAPTRTKGRPRLKGDRLGTLEQIAAGATWHRVKVTRYGRTKTTHLACIDVRWHGTWKDTPARVVLVRDTKRRRGYYDLALITTDMASTPAQIIEGYARRWPIEVVFRQAREVLGVGQAHNRTARAVQRTVPFGLYTYTMIILWYVQHADPASDVATHRANAPWYTTKTEVSFHDMLQALRRVIIAAQFPPGCPDQPTPAEIRAVQTAWAQAA